MNDPDSPPQTPPIRRLRPASVPPSDSEPVPDTQWAEIHPAQRPASGWQTSATPLVAEVPTLRRYAIAWLGDSGIADELVHGCLMFALQSQTGLLEPTRTRIWLLSVLYRLREHQLERSQARRPMALQRLGDELLQRASGLERIDLQALIRALAQLPEEDRALLLLVELEGLGYRDTSDVLNCPIGTVVARLSATRERLRVLIGGDDEVSLRATREGVHEAELHAYLDGELGSGRIDAVESYLEATRSTLARLWTYQRQGDQIRRLYVSLLNRPLPADLLQPAEEAGTSTIRPPWLKALIAVGIVVLLVLGGAGGWLARDYLASEAGRGLIDQAGAAQAPMRR